MPSAKLAALAAPVSMRSTSTTKKTPRSRPSGRTNESSVLTPAHDAPHAKRPDTSSWPPNFARLLRPRERLRVYFTRSSRKPIDAIPTRARTASNPPGRSGSTSTPQPRDGPHSRRWAIR